jgi:hypothetical protein
MYTHTNHTRALIFDLQFEKNTVKPSADFPHQQIPFVHSLATLGFSRIYAIHW